jgi:hypothetical protein
VDEEEFLELLLPALDSIEGISEVRATRSGARIEMEDGTRWRLLVENTDDEDDE